MAEGNNAVTINISRAPNMKLANNCIAAHHLRMAAAKRLNREKNRHCRSETPCPSHLICISIETAIASLRSVAAGRRVNPLISREAKRRSHSLNYNRFRSMLESLLVAD